MSKYTYFVFKYECNLVMRRNCLQCNKYNKDKSSNKEVAYGLVDGNLQDNKKFLLVNNCLFFNNC